MRPHTRTHWGEVGCRACHAMAAGSPLPGGSGGARVQRGRYILGLVCVWGGVCCCVWAQARGGAWSTYCRGRRGVSNVCGVGW